jgi:hypothetical protein
MKHEEVAPPLERWPEHLHDLPDGELEALANDYRWLDEESHASVQPEFHKRREAIIAECKRRGRSELAAACEQPGK